MAAGVSFDETRVADLRYGLVCGSDTAETMPAPDTASGTIQKREDWQKIIVETQVIPMVKGMALGVDLKPQAPRTIGNVKITVTHPPFIGSELTTDSWTANFDATGSNLNFFEFEHPYELVEGQRRDAGMMWPVTPTVQKTEQRVSSRIRASDKRKDEEIPPRRCAGFCGYYPGRGMFAKVKPSRKCILNFLPVPRSPHFQVTKSSVARQLSGNRCSGRFRDVNKYELA